MIEITKNTTVADLAASSRVYLGFHLLDVKWDFLRANPSEWHQSSKYEKLANYTKVFRVTNDCAERSVQMFSEYHGKVTKDEQQRQYLMSTIQHERRERSDLSRKALTEKHQNR